MGTFRGWGLKACDKVWGRNGEGDVKEIHGGLMKR